MSEHMMLLITGTLTPVEGSQYDVEITCDADYSDKGLFNDMLYQCMKANRECREHFIAAVTRYLASDPARTRKFSTVLDMILRSHINNKAPLGKLRRLPP